MILRFAGSGPKFGYSIDGMFFSIGTTVGFCIIVTVTIIAHAIGDKISLMELTSNAMGVLLFFAVGITGVANSKLSQILSIKCVGEEDVLKRHISGTGYT